MNAATGKPIAGHMVHATTEAMAGHAWRLALAGHCSGLGLEENKLTCADTHLWAGITK